MSEPTLLGGQSRYGHPVVPVVKYFWDFLGDVGVAAPAPWVETSGTATTDHISDADGILRLALTTGGSGETSRIDFGDSLQLDMSRLKYIEFGVRINFTTNLEASQTIYIGLGSAHNATRNNTVTNLWFMLTGANVNILWESDDANTDDDANDSGIDIVAGALTVFRIEPGGSPGVIGCSPKMFVDGQEVGGVPDGGINMRSLAASTLVQPVVENDDTSSATINNVEVDWISFEQERSTT